MSARTARKMPVFVLAAAAACFALTACDGNGGNASSDGAQPSPSASQSDTPAAKPGKGSDQEASPGTHKKQPGVKCTDQVNYADDARSNAEINSIGEDTGTCPPVQKGTTAPDTHKNTKQPGVKCTDQVNYADDARSNAEINSIGEDTGTCPPVQK